MADGCKFVQFVLQVVLITGGLNTEIMTVTGSSVSDPSSYNFFANHRPRFKIPKGNLSYYRRPQWEINYFMRYGTFPFYATSSPFLNRTEFWNKMRAIKDHLDRDSSGAEESGETTQIYNGENPPSALFVPISGEEVKTSPYGSMYYPGTVLETIKTLKRSSPKKNGDFLRQRLLPDNGQRIPVAYFEGDNEAGQDSNGVAAEMTIERKVGRKFQTQGWK